MNPFARVAVWLSAFLTITSAAPAACAGVVAVIEVPLATFTDVAAVPPMVTVAPVAKFVPVIVTFVPPTVVPELGDMPVTVGGAPGVPAVVKLRIGPLAVTFAMVLPTIRQ